MQSEFIKSAFYPRDFPATDHPEICFIGKSNVGKSSLINTVLERKGLAKTGQTPGKTRLLNFFNVENKENKYVFVDLPGYGYAKVSKTEREEWKKSIEAYLKVRPQLFLCVLILDIRRLPDDADVQMIKFLEAVGRDYVIVLTKIDKLSNNQLFVQFRDICSKLSLDKDKFVLFSAVTRKGKDELWARIEIPS